MEVKQEEVVEDKGHPFCMSLGVTNLTNVTRYFNRWLVVRVTTRTIQYNIIIKRVDINKQRQLYNMVYKSDTLHTMPKLLWYIEYITRSQNLSCSHSIERCCQHVPIVCCCPFVLAQHIKHFNAVV